MRCFYVTLHKEHVYPSNTQVLQTPNSSVTYPDMMNVKIKILQRVMISTATMITNKDTHCPTCFTSYKRLQPPAPFQTNLISVVINNPLNYSL